MIHNARRDPTPAATPTLGEVRTVLRAAAGGTGADRSYDDLVAATGPAIDLALSSHRHALHRWLNAWGCRIRYPRPGEPDRFDASVARWWDAHGRRLPSVDVPLAELTDAHIVVLADAFDDLSRSAVATDQRDHVRTMGATAAAKSLYALRPRAVMPWDLTIARLLHGGRDRAAFARHLELGRAWTGQLLATSGLDEQQLAAEMGRPAATLPKALDEFCYVRYTQGR